MLKIALICSLLGLIILYIVAENISIDEKTIDKINKDDFGSDVKIKGAVNKIIDLENVMIVEITQPTNMPVVLFKEEDINLSEGDYIEVIGEIDEYNGELEVIGHRVRVIS